MMYILTDTFQFYIQSDGHKSQIISSGVYMPKPDDQLVLTSRLLTGMHLSNTLGEIRR